MLSSSSRPRGPKSITCLIESLWNWIVWTWPPVIPNYLCFQKTHSGHWALRAQELQKSKKMHLLMQFSIGWVVQTQGLQSHQISQFLIEPSTKLSYVDTGAPEVRSLWMSRNCNKTVHDKLTNIRKTFKDTQRKHFWKLRLYCVQLNIIEFGFRCIIFRWEHDKVLSNIVFLRALGMP